MRTSISSALLACLLGASQFASAGDYLMRIPQLGLRAPAAAADATPPPVIASSPVALDYAAHTGVGTLSTDGLTWMGYAAYIRATVGSSQNFYFEITPTDGGYVDVGLTDGGAGNGMFEVDIRGDLYIGASAALAHYGSLPTHVGIAWEAAAGTVHIYYEGVRVGSRYLGVRPGPVYPVLYSNGGTISATFNANSFAARMPAGYSALR